MRISFYKMGFFFLGLALMTAFFTHDKYMLISGNAYFLALAAVCFGIETSARNKMRFTPDSWPIAVFFTAFLFSVALAVINSNVSRGVALTYMLMSFLLFVAVNYDISKEELHRLIRFFIAGGFIAAFLLVFFNVDFYRGYRFSLRFGSGPTLDPNYLGAYLSIATALSFRMLLYQNRLLLRGIVSGLLLLGTLMTGSRAAMLSVSLSALFTIIHYQSMRQRNLLSVSNFAFIAFAASIVLCVLFILPKGTIAIFITSYKDGSNAKRLYFWRSALQVIRKSWLFGYGCMEDTQIMRLYFGAVQPTHNTFLCMALQMGLWGLGSFVYLICQQLVKAWKSGDYNLVGIILNVSFTSCIIGSSSTLTFWGTLLLAIFMNRFANPWKKRCII